MAIYAVWWQLNGPKPEEQEDKLWKALEKFEHFFDPDIPTIMFIQTSMKPVTLNRHLYKYLEASDKLFFCTLSRNFDGQTYSGQMSQAAWDWLLVRLKGS